MLITKLWPLRIDSEGHNLVINLAARSRAATRRLPGTAVHLIGVATAGRVDGIPVTLQVRGSPQWC